MTELTDRELEVLRLLAEGLSREQIGRRVFMSLDGIKQALRRIYRKLEAINATHAVSIGYQRGLLKVG